jgi:hypothetical protein
MNGALTLMGQNTLWALNEPMWASLTQLENTLSVTVDVRLSSPVAVAGLAVRVSSSEPASFYLLKLVHGGDGHTFVRVENGVETVLGPATPGVCNISTTIVHKIKLMQAGPTLHALCDGVEFGLVVDESPQRLTSGTAGLYADSGAKVQNSYAVFDNLFISRGCADAEQKGCSAALPGELCLMSCRNGAAYTPNPHSQRLRCGEDGKWSGPPLQCIGFSRAAAPVDNAHVMLTPTSKVVNASVNDTCYPQTPAMGVDITGKTPTFSFTVPLISIFDLIISCRHCG